MVCIALGSEFLLILLVKKKDEGFNLCAGSGNANLDTMIALLVTCYYMFLLM